MLSLQSILSTTSDTLMYNQSEPLNEDTSELGTHYVLHYRQDLPTIALFLKLHTLIRCTAAVDVTVVDQLSNPLRFNVFYFIQSYLINTRVTLVT
jgi:NADH:ubiquinone oxidoreductase subunit C